MKFVRLTMTAVLMSFALLGVAKAATCPSIEAIQAVGLSHAGHHNGNFVVTQYDNYGTGQTWGFGLSNVVASNFGDALTKANNALSGLTMSQKARQVGATVTVCFYNTAAGYAGTAMTVE